MRYRYRLPLSRTVPMVLVAFAIPAALGYIASTNRGSVRLFGLWTLSPSEAGIFFWSFAGLCLAAAAVAAWIAIRNHRGPGVVELLADAALVPEASLRARMLRIPYASIRSIDVVTLSRQPMLVLKSSVGESRLLAQGFVGAREFEDFCQSLRAKAGGGGEP
jgi:hypothetical protein